MPVMFFHTVPQVFKRSSRVAYGIFNGNAAAFVRFNGRCLAVMGKNPIMSTEFQNKGMGMALVYEPAGPKTEMANDNSALYDTGQPLKAVVQFG